MNALSKRLRFYKFSGVGLDVRARLTILGSNRGAQP